MNKQLKIVPKFRSEAEERAFWEKHDSADYLDWTKAQRVTLPQHLLDSIKTAANARDVPYQSLIKVWLQEKLHSN
jgi:predicted DNA binding CopG/RHH family protein